MNDKTQIKENFKCMNSEKNYVNACIDVMKSIRSKRKYLLDLEKRDCVELKAGTDTEILRCKHEISVLTENLCDCFKNLVSGSIIKNRFMICRLMKKFQEKGRFRCVERSSLANDAFFVSLFIETINQMCLNTGLSYMDEQEEQSFENNVIYKKTYDNSIYKMSELAEVLKINIVERILNIIDLTDIAHGIAPCKKKYEKMVFNFNEYRKQLKLIKTLLKDSVENTTEGIALKEKLDLKTVVLRIPCNDSRIQTDKNKVIGEQRTRYEKNRFGMKYYHHLSNNFLKKITPTFGSRIFLKGKGIYYFVPCVLKLYENRFLNAISSIIEIMKLRKYIFSIKVLLFLKTEKNLNEMKQFLVKNYTK
jgi:hypothetical protein